MNKKTKMIIMITAAIIAVAAIAGGIIYFISSRNDNQPPTLTEVVESRCSSIQDRSEGFIRINDGPGKRRRRPQQLGRKQRYQKQDR